ncbi:MAG: YfhO family protein [Lentisphaerae bacterium]|nr:YfhO family protein [Lentisphaerota bacterium]
MDAADANAATPPRWAEMLRPGAPARLYALAAAAIPVVVIAVFGTVLAAPGERILSDLGTDTARQFLSWRVFGFGELAQGRLPLWNPFIYCGTPYFAGFQSALLYPVNWVHLVLPVATAITVEVILNLTILGLGMAAWLWRRGRSPAACLCGGLAVALGGGAVPHVYAGHLTNLASLAWSPAVLLCLEGAWAAFASPGVPAARRRRWCLAGAAAVAMQILAGHPQYVYYTALCAGLSLVLRLVVGAPTAHPRARQAPRLVLALAAVYAAGALLAAVQLLPGLLASTENLRAGRLPSAIAAFFSFPPENILTWLVPFVFGDMALSPYWGRWYLWEMCAFVGSAALPLAVWPLVSSPRRSQACADGLAVVLLTVLACGAYTPLYGLLYQALPGWGAFRCSAKLVAFAGFFVIHLAMSSLDRLLSEPRDAAACGRRLLGAAAIVTGALGAWAGLAAMAPGGLGGRAWSALLRLAMASGQSLLPPGADGDLSWRLATATCTAASALRSAAFLAGLLMALRLRRRRPAVALALPGLLILEMALFAAHFRASFAPDDLRLDDLRQLAAHTEPGQRLLHLPSHNLPMAAGIPDVWGNDPSLSRRYATFMALTQGQPLDDLSQDLIIDRLHPLLRLTGCRWVVLPDPDGNRAMPMTPEPLPRCLLLGAWAVLERPEDLHRRLLDPGFDPTREVLLEAAPGLSAGRGSAEGRVEVVAEDSDRLHLRVNCAGDAVLLISQAYSRHWLVRPARPDDDRRYVVMPANLAFQAVPLTAGRHEMVLEYRPAGLVIGAALSLLAAVAGLGAAMGPRGWKSRR